MRNRMKINAEVKYYKFGLESRFKATILKSPNHPDDQETNRTTSLIFRKS